jgi:peptidoglycan/xylan/chitin deacetylase (PgdA/CDA1 family)
VLSPIRIAYDAPPSSGGRLYPGGRKAAACISIDFDVTVADRLQANRAGTRALVELSEHYGVPLTWAICGMTTEDDGESYERILRSPMKKELGIHTYSHIDAQKADAKTFEDDIRKCLDVAGLRPHPATFIFPWNRENHFGVLRDLGFKTYRGKMRAIGAPRQNEGLYNIRPVYYVDQKSQGAESLMNHYADLCVATSSVFHLWTHPWSITIANGQPAPMLSTLRPVFAHLQELNEKGDIALCTMGELAEHFASPPSTGGIR